MRLDIIRTISDFKSIEIEWNTLLEKSVSHVPFLRHEYLLTWWETLGGGEWANGNLFVITGRLENGNLCGIAPVFFTRNKEDEQALMLLGSYEISDYLDFIIQPKDLKPFLETLLDFLANDETFPWKVLDLYNILDSSPTLQGIREVSKSSPWDYYEERLQPAPYISLPNDWDTYLAGLKKKQRHEIRRKMRRAAEYEIPIKWYIVEDETTLDDEMDAFLQLMSQDEKKETFLTDVMNTQMRTAVHSAFRHHWLQLAFIQVGNQKAAAFLNFIFKNRIWVYNSGIDYRFGKLSPGWVLLGHLIKWAIESGIEEFDFMRGDEDYKYRFGGINRHVMHVQLRRN